jgi:predicted GIY-YIG superfamily endonuclease
MRSGAPWELIHAEIFQTRSEALGQEHKIKARDIGRYVGDIDAARAV